MNQWLKVVGSKTQANQNWADQIQQFIMPVHLFWFLEWNTAIINCNKFCYTTVSEAEYDCAWILHWYFRSTALYKSVCHLLQVNYNAKWVTQGFIV